MPDQTAKPEPPTKPEGCETAWRRIFQTPSARVRKDLEQEAGIRLNSRGNRPW